MVELINLRTFMQVSLKEVSKTKRELKVEVPPEELEKYFDRAAQKLANEVEVPGFRKGKAPRKVIENQLGVYNVFEEGIRIALPEILEEAIKEAKIEAIGQPDIKVDKMAPGNPFIFLATLEILPEFELPDWRKMNVQAKKIEIEPKKIDEALNQLAKSRTKISEVDRAAEKDDLVYVDFKTFQNKVPVENGEGKNHPVIIGEGYFVPGFEDHLIGMKKGGTKEFSLEFPKDYHQKNLAGKPVDFKVEVRQVQKREVPKIDDEFAKSLGKFKNVEDLRKKIGDNLRQEAEEKEKSRQEMEMVEKIGEKIEVEIPRVLIDRETEKMINELKGMVEAQGGKFDQYLENIKKTEEDLKKDFRPKAEKRSKMGLILRKLAEAENVEVSEKEIAEEITKTSEAYQYDPKMVEKIQSPAYAGYIEEIKKNRKVFEMLGKAMIVEESGTQKEKEDRAGTKNKGKKS